MEEVDTLVVGAGQAGIAMSEHLGKSAVPHLVLERYRIAERWRSERWDSLVANGPAWHDRFPGMEFAKTGPDGFPTKEEIANYFTEYARMIDAPIRTGIEVMSVKRLPAHNAFRVDTSDASFRAWNVVAATGPFQIPAIPPLLPEESGIHQIHSSAYHNPGQLPEGGVLVVGAGSSGAQIADELLKSGRKVYLSIGPHDRPPRSYRGRDFVWWLGVLGKWDSEFTPGNEHVTIAVSGAHGGQTVDFRRFAERGMVLTGRTEAFEKGIVRFAPDLARNIAAGDANYLSVLDEADAYIATGKLDLPEEPEARIIGPDPECVRNPLAELDLRKEGVNSIIWATGYRLDFSWLPANALDEKGQPKHQRGVSVEPGIYFLGMPWLTRRGSSFIWGVWHDAKFVADHIATRRKYRIYEPEKR
jgi:putative flavoprotein involved in K+ transport